MTEKIRHYRAFLLRLWLAGDGETPEWRVTIEDVATNERRTFDDIQGLVTFLHTLAQSDVPCTVQPRRDTTVS